MLTFLSSVSVSDNTPLCCLLCSCSQCLCSACATSACPAEPMQRYQAQIQLTAAFLTSSSTAAFGDAQQQQMTAFWGIARLTDASQSNHIVASAPQASARCSTKSTRPRLNQHSSLMTHQGTRVSLLRKPWCNSPDCRLEHCSLGRLAHRTLQQCPRPDQLRATQIQPDALVKQHTWQHIWGHPQLHARCSCALQ